MRVENERESQNVDDQRNKPASSAKKGGCLSLVGAVLVALIVGAVKLCTPSPAIDAHAPTPYEHTKPRDDGAVAKGEDGTVSFTKKVLATTEDYWPKAMHGYTDPTLVLFKDHVQSACGAAASETGPFYCSLDQKLYIDTSFFKLMHDKLGAPGDFAQAYVVAHEVGHHVQKLAGVFDHMQKLDDASGKNGANVRMELQADCYAGMWAASVKNRRMLDAGDVDEALRAASMIGDDYLQKRQTGNIMPDGFTHGTSAQRVKWLKIGMSAGNNTAACDTFRANPL